MSAHEQQHNVAHALPAGHRFNEFEIQDVIGGGGFGIVYRAWDHQLERTIAIKEYLPLSLAVRDEDLCVTLRGERFQKLFQAGLNSFIQEARLLARFNHPGLLHVLRFWEENGTAYMGTLYYNGVTLKEWKLTRRGSLNEAWIRQLLPPLFGAINTLHRAGYLHRDISLDNIQIQENQQPVLLDFGSARKEIGNLSDETEIMLKPGYAPIEQYSEEGDNNQGPWTDVYALGAVLHALITGNPPPVSVVRCIEDHYQPLATRRPPGYSLPLLQAIDQALAMQPQQRPQSIDELAALIALPVNAVEPPIAAVSQQNETSPLKPEPEPEMLAVNAAAGAVEPIISARPPRVSRALLLLCGIALLAVIAVVWLLNRAPQQTVTASNLPADTPPAVSAPAMATVYLKLNRGESLLLNGSVMEVKPNNSGYASLNLAAGVYQLEVRGASGTHSQQLKIERAGTWLINPGR